MELGVYFESIDFIGQQPFVSSSGGSAVTTFDASGAGSVVNANSGEAGGTRLFGFTLRGGTKTFDPVAGESRGGTVFCEQSSLELRDWVLPLIGNQSFQTGAATPLADMGSLMFEEDYNPGAFVNCRAKINSQGCELNQFTTGFRVHSSAAFTFALIR
ncbi:MAG: hypothetical protein ACI835_004145 [Planctomycetota bacterium]